MAIEQVLLLRSMPDEQLAAMSPSPFCGCAAGLAARRLCERRVASWTTFTKQTADANRQAHQEQKSKLFIDSGIPTRFKGFDLTSFRMRFGGDAGKEEALKAAQTLRDTGKIAKGRDAKGNDRGFYWGLWLYGSFGQGKTSILAGTFAPLVERLGGGLWLPYLSFLDQVRNGIESNTATSMKQAAMQTPVLLLEDLGSMGREMETPYSQEVLWQIIYHRNANNLLTMVSSNLSKTGIISHFGEVGDGLFQRLAEFMAIIEVKGRLIRDIA